MFLETVRPTILMFDKDRDTLNKMGKETSRKEHICVTDHSLVDSEVFRKV